MNLIAIARSLSRDQLLQLVAYHQLSEALVICKNFTRTRTDDVVEMASTSFGELMRWEDAEQHFTADMLKEVITYAKKKAKPNVVALEEPQLLLLVEAVEQLQKIDRNVVEMYEVTPRCRQELVRRSIVMNDLLGNVLTGE